MIYLSKAGELETKIVSIDELKKAIENLESTEDVGYEACELVEIDSNNNMYFEIRYYSIY